MFDLKKVLFILDASNFVIAFAGACLTVGSCHLFAIQTPYQYGFLSFCLIFSVYFFQRVIDRIGKTRPKQTAWGARSCFFVALSSCLLVIGLLLGLRLLQYSFIQISLITLFSFVCAWYVIPFFGAKLREIGGLKLLLIAATWTYTCVVFPYLNQYKEASTELLYFTLLLFLYICAMVLPFDIRDCQNDLLQQGTIPQLIGVRMTKLVGLFLLLLFLVGMYLLERIEPTNVFVAGSVILQMVLLVFTTEWRPFYYFLFIDFSIALLGLSFLL